MSEGKTNNGGILQSVISGIVLSALVGIGTSQIKNSEKLSDIRANVMPRDEIEVRLHQMVLDIKQLEMACHANAIAISELQMELRQTIRTRLP